MKIHQNVMFFMIERTNSVKVDISDWIVTCLGNDEAFLTVCDTKCSSGHRTGC